MVGAVSVARALPEGPEAQAMLEAALRQAIALIDGAETGRQKRKGRPQAAFP
jgi:hypothetical protein